MFFWSVVLVSAVMLSSMAIAQRAGVKETLESTNYECPVCDPLLLEEGSDPLVVICPLISQAASYIQQQHAQGIHQYVQQIRAQSIMTAGESTASSFTTLLSSNQNYVGSTAPYDVTAYEEMLSDQEILERLQEIQDWCNGGEDPGYADGNVLACTAICMAGAGVSAYHIAIAITYTMLGIGFAMALVLSGLFTGGTLFVASLVCYAACISQFGG